MGIKKKIENYNLHKKTANDEKKPLKKFIKDTKVYLKRTDLTSENRNSANKCLAEAKKTLTACNKCTNILYMLLNKQKNIESTTEIVRDGSVWASTIDSNLSIEQKIGNIDIKLAMNDDELSSFVSADAIAKSRSSQSVNHSNEDINTSPVTSYAISSPGPASPRFINSQYSESLSFTNSPLSIPRNTTSSPLSDSHVNPTNGRISVSYPNRFSIGSAPGMPIIQNQTSDDRIPVIQSFTQSTIH